MAGAACKVIINNGIRGLSASLEEVLLSPLVRGVMVDTDVCDKLIQRMADIDLATYDPESHTMPTGGLSGILVELVGYKVLTDEIWEIFHQPCGPQKEDHLEP